jgi:ribosomal protein S18 acetylase RimI-like enzyme
MSTRVLCREAGLAAVAALARIRGADRAAQEYWRKRIGGYLRGEIHPQKALKERVVFLAEISTVAIGLVAGHLSRRYECHGELQWVNVLPDYQREGIASRLLWRLAEWFTKHGAARVCVDVSPENTGARQFYRRHGAEDMNRHWLVWPDMRMVKPDRTG